MSPGPTPAISQARRTAPTTSLVCGVAVPLAIATVGMRADGSPNWPLALAQPATCTSLPPRFLACASVPRTSAAPPSLTAQISRMCSGSLTIGEASTSSTVHSLR